MYKTASCAEIAGNYFYHCEKVAKKWPKFKEIGTKNIKLANVVAKEKKILARTLLTPGGASCPGWFILPPTHIRKILLCDVYYYLQHYNNYM